MQKEIPKFEDENE